VAQPLKKPQLPRGPGTVVIAAAGDISPDQIAEQKATSEIVLAGDFDAVVLLGDDQYPAGSLEGFQKFFHPTWGRFKDKIWPSAGNHEYATPGAKGYFDYFGARAGEPGKGYYSFDLGSWHLIALNTSDGCKAVPCGEGSEQLKWLEEDLQKSDKKCTLGFWHYPRFSSGPHGDFADIIPVWNVLTAHGVDLVLNGHDHLYERFPSLTPQGVPDEKGIAEFVVGTGGAENYPVAVRHAHSAVVDAHAHGVLALALGPEGYAWDFLAAPGSTFTDRGEGKCH
jgi:hypothetical protein